MPAAAASSTAYWRSGRSTIGSISFATALVAGKKRVPSPATGNTAFRTTFVGFRNTDPLSESTSFRIEVADEVEAAVRLMRILHIIYGGYLQTDYSIIPIIHSF